MKLQENISGNIPSSQIIVYHGSQNDNLAPDFARGFYLTNNKEMAIDFAKGYLFNYELADNETPTLYTYEVSFANPYIVKSEEEYETHFTDRDVSEIITPLKQAGYDGIIIPEFGTGCKYYVVFDNTRSVKLIKKETATLDEVVYQNGDILNENGTQNKKIIAYYLTRSKDIDNFSLDYIPFGLGSLRYGIYFTKDISIIKQCIRKHNSNDFFIYTVTLGGNIIKGWELYSELVDKNNGNVQLASLDMVEKYNIDGISYYSLEDGNSFVIFNPNIIKIIKKEKVVDSKLLNESVLDLDPEELSKNREEDKELEKLSFQRPNKPMSKELRELLYGKKPSIQKSTTQKVSSKNNEDDVFTDPVVRSYSSYYNDEYNKFQKQLADIKFDIAYAEEHGDNPQQSKAELRNLEQKIYNRAKYNLLLLDLLENKVYKSSKLNEDFYRWFQDSKVITETHEPKMVSLSENPKKVYGKGIYFDKEDNGGIKAYLQISNPFRLNEQYSISTFRPYIENIDILCNKQKISGKELFSLLIEAKYGIQLNKMIDTTTMLQNLGFDGIETKNKWIAFSKKQIQKL